MNCVHSIEMRGPTILQATAKEKKRQTLSSSASSLVLCFGEPKTWRMLQRQRISCFLRGEANVKECMAHQDHPPVPGPYWLRFNTLRVTASCSRSRGVARCGNNLRGRLHHGNRGDGLDEQSATKAAPSKRRTLLLAHAKPVWAIMSGAKYPKGPR